MEMEVTLAAVKPISLMQLVASKSSKKAEIMNLKDAVDVDHRLVDTLAADKDSLAVKSQPKCKSVLIETISWSYFYKIAKLNDPTPIYSNSRDFFTESNEDLSICAGERIDDFLEKNKKYNLKEYLRITGFMLDVSHDDRCECKLEVGQIISISVSPYGVSSFKKKLMTALAVGSSKKNIFAECKVGKTTKNTFVYVDVSFVD